MSETNPKDFDKPPSALQLFPITLGSPVYCLHHHLKDVRNETLRTEVHENSFVGSYTGL